MPPGGAARLLCCPRAERGSRARSKEKSERRILTTMIEASGCSAAAPAAAAEMARARSIGEKTLVTCSRQRLSAALGESTVCWLPAVHGGLVRLSR